jgi:hypothetical protein
MTGSSRGARIGTFVVATLSLSLTIAGTVISLALNGEFDFSAESGILAMAVAAPILGLILILRVGAPRIGGLFLAMGLGLGMASLGAGIPSHPDYVDWLWLIPFANAGWMIFLALTVAGLPLLFPTGDPPTSRWRPVLWSLLVLLSLVTVMSLFSEQLTLTCSDVWPEEADCSVWEQSDQVLAIGECEAIIGPLGEGRECNVFLDNPIGITAVQDSETGPFGSFLYIGLLVIAALSIASLGLRFHRAGQRERQQIKLVFFVLGIFVASILIEAFVVDVLGRFLPVMEVIDFLMWVAIPLSIFLAITRYRLYDIDRLISRTITYTLVVGVLITAVAGLATVVGTQFEEPWVVAATTLGVAAMFNPLRRRVQVWVDRRFNRSRYDAEQVMDEFAGCLRDEVDGDEVVDGWVRAVTDTMQPSAMGVWVRGS